MTHFMPIQGRIMAKTQSVNTFSYPLISSTTTTTIINEDESMKILKENLIARHRETIDHFIKEPIQQILSPHECPLIWHNHRNINNTATINNATKIRESIEYDRELIELTLSWIDESDKSLLSLTNLEYTQMKAETFMGDYYVFLMTHSVASKTNSYTGFTKQPLRDIYLHNNKKMGDRTTAEAAPYWIPTVVVGPFLSRMEAIECGLVWANGSRGKHRKRAKGEWLGQAFDCNVYDNEQKLDCHFVDYLKKEMPLFYSEIYENLIK